jgi:DUF1680 family protein
MLWYHRLFLNEGHGAELDAFERTLYNGYLSGVSAKGDSFFYQNPLQSDGTVERSMFFDVACCPANLARLMEQLPGLIYATRDDILFVNLFIGSSAKTSIAGTPIAIRLQTRYPWDGMVRIALQPDQPTEFTLNVRVPGWARNQATASDLYRFASPVAEPVKITVNGEPVALAVSDGFQAIRRRWQRGDVVEASFPMPARRVVANEAVSDDRGKAAIQRGPVVYAVEGVDNGGRALDVVLPIDAPLRTEFRKDLLNGLEVVTAQSGPRTVTAIPYFAWANRGKGEMAVWIPTGGRQ